MKKLFALLMIAGMFSFVACGPKQEENANAGAEAEQTVSTEVEQTATETAATDSTAQQAPAATDSAVAK